MQKNKQKSSADTEEVAVEAQTEKSQQISEDAACCLAEIDAVLEDCENRELTDEEILAKGIPDQDDFWSADLIKELDQVYDQYFSGKITREQYLATPAAIASDKAGDKYDAAMERYAQAFRNIYGVSFDPCTC